MHAYLRNRVNPLPGRAPPPSVLLLLLRLPVAVGNDGLVQQASSCTACLLASLPVGGSIWCASRADEWTKHNLSTKDKSTRRQCGSLFITVSFFFLLPKKSACFSHTHIVFRHMAVSHLWSTLIFTATASERSSLSPATPPRHPNEASHGGSVQPGVTL